MKNGVVKFAVVMTVLGAIGSIIYNYKNPAELIGNLTIGSIGSFVFWLLIGAIAVWIKDKLSGGPKGAVSTKDNNINKLHDTKTTSGIEPSAAGQNAGMKKCPECSRDNLANVTFCSYCGHRFGLICPNCGRENLPDARICGYCGSQLGESAQIVIPAVDYSAKQSHPESQQYEKDSARNISREREKAWRRRTNLWGTVFTTAIVLAVVFLIYSFGAFGRGSIAAISPTATRPAPTIAYTAPTPTQQNTPTTISDPCISADKINNSYRGTLVCVFGIVVRAYQTQKDVYNNKTGNYEGSIDVPPFVIDLKLSILSLESSKLESSSSVLFNLKRGDCIEITGMVQTDKDGLLYIDPNIGPNIRIYKDASRCS